jgi:hypothetical protein
MKSILMGALVFTALAAQLAAGTVNVEFIGANGQKDSSGYLISPYTATINGVSTTVYCDDFANTVSDGQTYTANETNLGSGNLSLTRYGTISQSLQTQSGTQTFDAQQLYEMAAWLTTQFTTNGSSNGDIQDTLWDLFNPNPNNPNIKPPKPSTNSWLFAAEENYTSINPSAFTILTNTGVEFTGTGQVQEFIFSSPVAQSPEPASMALLGIGLILLSIFGRRVTSRDESKRARVQAN